MTEDEKITSALGRVERRVKNLLHRYDKLKRLIVEKKWTGDEETRIWLQQFSVGKGMDVCCGDFLIDDNATGVDFDYHKIGIDKFMEGDEINDESPEAMDYIVSNYIDTFENPFKLFTSWHRLLKPGGTLAFSCRNADVFSETDSPGPLKNRNRHCLYTPKLIRFYLDRLGFDTKIIELFDEEKTIRVMARKK